MQNAAVYLRSSKDRSDVSLSAQLRELSALATQKQLTIARTYEDAVQSGSTEDRPAFSELISDIRNPSRGWSQLLVYDTSRIARGRHIAQAFRHECRRRGVELIIARVPDTDPISAVIIESVMEAMDEVHSLMSREKGLAGMRENVRRGFRAGGRAPWGYSLQHEPTGAVRDGKPVMKSRLVPSIDAGVAGRYLTFRASGVPRVESARRLKITLPPTTLIGIEWNALVYSGHTIWNKHAPKRDRGSGRCKRRDRSDWVIQRDTHVALITEAQAEAIVAQLETSDIGRAVSAAKSSRGDYLLSGILETTAGDRWCGAGDHYRLKPAGDRRGRRIQRGHLETAILERIRWDLRAPELVDAIVKTAQAAHATETPAAAIAGEIQKLGRRRDRAARLSIEYEGDAYTRLVSEIDRQITALRRESDAIALEQRAGDALRSISPAQVREVIAGIGNDRALVKALVGRVVLDPDLREARIDYGLTMASPRAGDRWAEPVCSSIVKLAA